MGDEKKRWQNELDQAVKEASQPMCASEEPREWSKAIRDADYMEVPEEINVYSWSPAPPGAQDPKCTQVHLHFGKPPGPVFFVRFKGPRTLDKIIAALRDHREDVWGPDTEQLAERSR